MIFEENKTIERLGKNIGYIIGYFLFTTILFFILFLFKKIPETWSYFHIMAITALIALAGFMINWLLK